MPYKFISTITNCPTIQVPRSKFYKKNKKIFGRSLDWCECERFSILVFYSFKIFPQSDNVIYSHLSYKNWHLDVSAVGQTDNFVISKKKTFYVNG